MTIPQMDILPGFLPRYHQARIHEWNIRDGHKPIHPKYGFLKTLEEMIELGYASGASIGDIQQVVDRETQKAIERGEDNGVFDKDKAGSEIGDVLVSLEVFTQDNGIDGLLAVNRCFHRIASRQWSPDEFGILRRPK